MATNIETGTQASGSRVIQITPSTAAGANAPPYECTITIEVYTTSTGAEATPTGGTLLLEGLTNRANFYKTLYTFDLTSIDSAYELAGRFIKFRLTPTNLDADKSWRIIVNSGN